MISTKTISRKTIATFTGLLLLTSSLTGCIRAILPTSEAELMDRSRIVSDKLDTDVVSSYANLKTYMEKCLEFSHSSGYQVVDSNLNRQSGEAHFIGRSNFNTYTFKVTLQSLDDDTTKITYFSPKKKIGFSESNPQKTLNKLKSFAKYDGKPTCRL